MSSDLVSEGRDGVDGRGEAGAEGSEVSVPAGDVGDFVVVDDLEGVGGGVVAYGTESQRVRIERSSGER